MKKRLFSFLTTFIMIFSFVGVMPKLDIKVEATQDRSSNFKIYVPLTGDGATDVVNIAKAYIGKNGAYFGYTEEWCADFVSDFAAVAGQSAAIPRHGACENLWDNIKGAGGVEIAASQVQSGDILFYGTNGGSHVEIVYANNNGIPSTIGGNSGGISNNSQSLVRDHKNQNGQPIVYKALRPNYRGVPTDTEYPVINNAGSYVLDSNTFRVVAYPPNNTPPIN